MFILVTDLLLLFLPSFQDLIDSVITLSSILSAIWEWPEIVQLLLLGIDYSKSINYLIYV